MWRICQLRNELEHGKLIPPLEVSCSFLISYYNSFNQISLSIEENIKGKSPMLVDVPVKQPLLKPTTALASGRGHQWDG